MYRVLLSLSVRPVMEKDLYSLMAMLSWYHHSHTCSPVSKHWYRHMLQKKRTCSCNNYNFEGLKLQFPALSSPYPLCYRKTSPSPRYYCEDRPHPRDVTAVSAVMPLSTSPCSSLVWMCCFWDWKQTDRQTDTLISILLIAVLCILFRGKVTAVFWPFIHDNPCEQWVNIDVRPLILYPYVYCPVSFISLLVTAVRISLYTVHSECIIHPFCSLVYTVSQKNKTPNSWP